MNYKKIKKLGIIQGYTNIITRDHSLENSFAIRSSFDFSVLDTLKMGEDRFAIHYLEEIIALSDLKEQHIVIKPKECKFVEYSGKGYCIINYQNWKVFYNPNENLYEVFDAGNLIVSFQKKLGLEYKILGLNCLEYTFDQQHAYIRSIDLRNGRERWRKNFKDNFTKLKCFLGKIIVNIDHSQETTLTLDIEDGKECWRYSRSYVKLNRNTSSVLYSGELITEIDFFTGIKTFEVSTKPILTSGSIAYFSDSEGIYYLTNDHLFGKIARADGTILWEFDLIDDKGEKRKLSDWILLGNGNLVLQAMPNHPNGDLTCIFNPNENLQYSNVIETKRGI